MSLAGEESFTAVPNAAGGGTNVVIHFDGVAGQSYTIQYATTLPPLWLTLVSVDPLAASGPLWATNTVPSGTLQRFYRLVTPRLP